MRSFHDIKLTELTEYQSSLPSRSASWENSFKNDPVDHLRVFFRWRVEMTKEIGIRSLRKARIVQEMIDG